MLNHLNRKRTAIFLALLLIFTLTGCGGDSQQAADPNVGLWTAVGAETQGVEIPVEAIAPEGFSLKLMDGGKAEMHLGDSYADGQWKLEDGVFTLWDETVTSTGSITDGVLLLENVMDSGVDMYFVQEDGEAASPDAVPDPETLTDVQRMWNGTWYGCMYVEEATETFESMPLGEVDIFMVVDVDAENEAYFALYLPGNEDPLMDGLALASLEGMNATDVFLMEDIALNASNWTFLPMREYPDQFTLGDTYDGEYGVLDFLLFMKPWGHSWEEELTKGAIYPPSVEDYHRMIAEGQPPMYGYAPADYVPGA